MKPAPSSAPAVTVGDQSRRASAKRLGFTIIGNDKKIKYNFTGGITMANKQTNNELLKKMCTLDDKKV